MAEISVVLPVYNAESSIARAVHSIIDQTFEDIELIVVNDGSTDRTLSVLEAIGDSRMRVESVEHVGVARAANLGTQLASAALIARMDADDCSHPTRLETQLRLLRNQKLDVVGCRVNIVDQLGKRVESLRRYQEWINEETRSREAIVAYRFVELPLVNQTILARRSYFQLGFRDNELPEDYDLMLRAAEAGLQFGKTQEILFDWVDRPQRITRSDLRYSDEAFMKCRREHLLKGPLRDVTEVDLWGVGKTGKPWLQWLQKNGMTVRRIYDVDTRKVGQRIHGVSVLHPSSLTANDGVVMVVAVGAENARQVIVPQLEATRYVVGVDAWFVA